MRRLLAVLILVVCVTLPSAVTAQGTPEAGEESGLVALFPHQSELWGEWQRQIGWVNIDPAFEDAAVAIYVGAGGERVLAIIAKHRPDRVNALGAWNVVEGWVNEAYANLVFDAAWIADPLPDGVIDGLRFTGADRLTWFMVSIGGYAIGADLVAYIVAPAATNFDGDPIPADLIAGLIAARAAGT